MNGIDSGNCASTPCASLSYALAQSGDGDAIYVAAGIYTDTVTISKNVTIKGNSAATTIFNAAPGQRVFTITAGITTTFQGLSVVGGNVSASAACGPTSGSSAGGLVCNLGYLALKEVGLVGGMAETGGALYNAEGAVADIINTTLSGNQARSDGGGLYNAGTLTLTFVTVADNLADSDRDGVGLGGGLFKAMGTVVVAESVVAGNQVSATLTADTADCFGAIASLGYNITGVETGCRLVATTDISLEPRQVFSELLESLDHATLTHALKPYSLAVGRVTPGEGDCSLNIITDQLGVARPQGLYCDVGAYEMLIVNPVLARDDAFPVVRDTADNLLDVVANDRSLDGLGLTILAVGVPNQGGQVFTTGAKLAYTPTLGFTGNEFFTYTIGDELDQLATAGVTVSVQLATADSGFRPSQDGYSFTNFTALQSQSTDESDSLVLIDMFGIETTCKVGTYRVETGTCIIDSGFRSVIVATIGNTYGQAYGIAVTTLRFFMDQETPADIVVGVGSDVTTLTRTTQLEGHLRRYSIQQGTEPKFGDNGWARGLTASQAFNQLYAELQQGRSEADPYLLMLYARNSLATHVVVPYRITHVGGNVYDLYVYDSHYPLDDTRAVRFDLDTQTWAYTSTTALGLLDLSGDSHAGNILDLRHLSGHQPAGLKIVGAQPASTTGGPSRPASLFAVGEPMAFSAGGCFALQGVADVNQTPDDTGQCNQPPPTTSPLQCTRVSDGRGGAQQLCGIQDPAVNLDFTLYPDANGGQSLMLVTNVGNMTHLEATGSGAGTLGVNLSPDAREAQVTSTITTTLPSLTFAVRGSTAAQPSYEVKISVASGMASDNSLTVRVDEATGRVYFSDTGSDVTRYNLEIQRQRADGTTTIFKANEVSLDGAAAYADFGNWSGGGSSLDLYVDVDGDGFGNDLPTPLQNQFGKLYLPIVIH